MKITPILFLAFTLIAFTSEAQIPIPNPGECGTSDIIEGVSETDTTPTEFYSLPTILIPFSRDVCHQYTYGGWETTMQLRLGEGADTYRDLIEMAVETWNRAVRERWQEPLIEIIDTPPMNPVLTRGFWIHSVDEIAENLTDEENVIYFYSDDRLDYRGFAKLGVERGPRGYRMKGADVYINISTEEEWPGYTLAKTKKILSVGQSHGVHAYINATYSIILHELGHAVGLKHIAATGNIMATAAFVDGAIDQWAPAMSLYQLTQSNGRFTFSTNDVFVQRNSDVPPYAAIMRRETLRLVDFYTKFAKLGEQEKMLLTCIYDHP